MVVDVEPRLSPWHNGGSLSRWPLEVSNSKHNPPECSISSLIPNPDQRSAHHRGQPFGRLRVIDPR